jgi:septum formation protein
MVNNKKIVLASNSPRRKEILSQAGFRFDVEVREIEESFPAEMELEKVPEFLAENKAGKFTEDLEDRLIITADTVVIAQGQILNKPQDKKEAIAMLTLLSDKEHKVVTGVCILANNYKKVFSDTTLVSFNKLTDSEINYYIDTCNPFDKAGSYGVQDFIGMIGVRSINGSFYNVMGLPIHKVYGYLKDFIDLNDKN